MATNNDRQPESILHLSKGGANLGDFHGNLEDFLTLALKQGIEAQLDGLHVARETTYPTQHQEGNGHGQ